MLKVTVGSADAQGFVFISYEQYKREMSEGGKKYHDVHTKDGIVSFRACYWRNVREAL